MHMLKQQHDDEEEASDGGAGRATDKPVLSPTTWQQAGSMIWVQELADKRTMSPKDVFNRRV
jgi:hypothetical protein